MKLKTFTITIGGKALVIHVAAVPGYDNTSKKIVYLSLIENNFHLH